MLRHVILFSVLLALGYSDESVNNYIKATLENLKAAMPNGIPELKIPPLDPLKIPDVNLNINEGVANLGLKLNSVKLDGLSKFTTESVTTDLEQLKLGLRLNLHSLSAQGLYHVDGKILFFPLYGNGRVMIKVDNVRVGGHAALTTTSEGYLHVNHFQLEKITFDKVELLLENILGGGNLANIINTVLNIMGKKIFDNFSPLISKELTEVIHGELNKELKKVKLEDILKGVIPGPAVKQFESDAQPYDASTNDFIDKLLVNVRSAISQENLDPLKLPDQVADFSKKILWVTVRGEAKLHKGYLRGLTSIRRVGDPKIYTEGDTVFLEAQLGLVGIRAGYTGHAKFQGIGPSISAHASVSHANIYIKLSQNLGNSNASPTLHELRITSLGLINTRIDGLGPLGWTLGKIASVVVNVVRGEIVKAIEGPIRNAIAKELVKVKLPI